MITPQSSSSSSTPVGSRAGFIAVLGIPNAGKSTLINRMVGTKVSIVSPKVQTTRRRILGILCQEETQMIFIDTPGIFQGKKPLEKAMVKEAWEAPKNADAVILLVDAAVKNPEPVLELAQKLKGRQEPLILCLNKIDCVPKEILLTLSQSLNALAPFEKTFMISALQGSGVQDLITYCAQHMPLGPWLYESGQISDLPQRFFAAEITREHLFRTLNQELPYALTVETESWIPFKDGSIKIGQIIYVQKSSQKAIVLGKGGAKIKAVGKAARQELTALLEQKIHLVLHVKVKEDWIHQGEHYQEMGLELPKLPKP